MRSKSTTAPHRSALKAICIASCALFTLLPLSSRKAVAQTAAGASELESIVVTAQRREEKLQDVPITITAVTGASLKEAAVGQTKNLPDVVPGLIITRSNSVPLIYVRGVGTQASSIGEEGTTAVYVDGVLESSLTASVLGLANVERVEVLKGPQGTLFGRNATGGVIQVVTKTPSFQPEMDAEVGYGNYQTFDSSVYGTTPLTDKIAINVSAGYHDQGKGFGINIFNGQEIYKYSEESVRSKLLWNIDDDTALTVAADYDKNISSNGNGRTCLPGKVCSGGSLYTGNFYYINNDYQPYSSDTQGGGSVRVEHDMSWAKIINLSAWRFDHLFTQFDVEGSPFAIIDIQQPALNHQFTEELQLQSPNSSRIKWIGGVFYLNSSNAPDPFQTIGSSVSAANGHESKVYSDMRTSSKAVFGQATVPLVFDTNFTAGLRYTSDKRALFGTKAFLATGYIPIQTVDESKTFDKLTWHFVLDHKWTPDVMTYASYTRGFKSGLYNTANLSNPAVNPEVLDSREVGLKSEFFDHRALLNVSGFLYQYRGVQLVQNLGGISNLLNAAQATVKGLDTELKVLPVQNLSLEAGATALFTAKYDNFPGAGFSLNNGLPIPAGVSCPSPVIAPPGGNKAGCNFNAAGKAMIRAPHLILNVGGHYDIPSSKGLYSVALNYTHTGKFFFEPDNRLYQPSYGILSSQLSWWQPDNRLGLRLWARNLTNAKYYDLQSSSAADVYAAGQPLTWGGAVDVKF